MDQTAHYITVLYIRGSFRNAEEAAFLFTVVRRSAIIMTGWRICYRTEERSSDTDLIRTTNSKPAETGTKGTKGGSLHT